MDTAVKIPEPGPEMDKLVCQAAGIEPDRIAIISDDGGKSARLIQDDLISERDVAIYLITMRENKRVENWEKLELLHWDKYPPVSTDDGAIWQIVDWMRETYGFDDHNEFVLVGQGIGAEWYCEFPKPLWTEGCANTRPHAICLAFLRAMGVIPSA